MPMGFEASSLPRQMTEPRKTTKRETCRRAALFRGGYNSVTPGERVRNVGSVFTDDDGRRRCCRRTRTPRLKVTLMYFEATSGAPV